MAVQETSTPQPLTPTARARVEHYLKYLYILLALLPISATLWLILDLGSPSPYMDDWEMVNLLIHRHQGTLGFAELWAQHNEARITIPRLIVLSLYAWQGWDSRLGMLLNLLLTVANFVLIYQLIRRALPDRHTLALILLIPTNILLFAWFQYETWLWQFLIVQVLPYTLLLAGLWIAGLNLRWTSKCTSLIVLSILAMWTFGSGLVLWFVLFPVLFLQHLEHPVRRYRWIAVWWIIAGLSILIYFHDYHRLGNESLRIALQQPWSAARYFLMFLGSPLTRGFEFALVPRLALIAGALSVATFLLAGVVCLVRARVDRALLHRAAPWLSLSAFVLACAAMTTTSRLEHGPEHALITRYTTASVYLTIALLHLLITLLLNPAAHLAPHRAIVKNFCVAALVISFSALGIWSSRDSFFHASEMVRGIRYGAVALQFSPVMNAEPVLIGNVYPDAAILQQRAQQASSLNILPVPLRESRVLPQPMIDPGARTCGLVTDIRVTRSELSATIIAVLPHRHRPADTVLLCDETQLGQPQVLSIMGIGRPLQNAADDAMKNCAFQFRLPTAALSRATQRLSFWAYDADTGASYRLHPDMPIPATIHAPITSP